MVDKLMWQAIVSLLVALVSNGLFLIALQKPQLMPNSLQTIFRCSVFHIWALACLLLPSVVSHAQSPLRRVFQPASVVQAIPYGANPAAGKYADAGDAKIYYEVYGSGDPIVLLHGGLLGSTVEFADFIDRFRKTYKVIAISTRGHGKSELGTVDMSLAQRAEDAMAVIKAVTDKKVTVLGFSDGGFAAYQLAADYPERIEKMVVIGAALLRPGMRSFGLSAAQGVALDTAYWRQQKSLMPDSNRLDDLFAGVNAFYNQATIAENIFSKIQCLVLVMAGDRDDGNPVEQIVAAARLIKQAQISIVPNAGHGVFLDNFAAVWAAIEPFVGKGSGKYINLSTAKLQPHQVSHTHTTVGTYEAIRVVKDPKVQLVDEPTFLRLTDSSFHNGEIEVKVLSRLLPDAPKLARGFIGLAFRINADNSKFESIYIRPSNGRADDQIRRNHSIQYFSYPDFKFDRLRQEAPERYEAYADMGLNDWITMRIVVKDATARLYLNGADQPSLIVNDLKHGADQSGGLGLWVDVGTEGYFRDLRVVVE